MNNKWYNKKEDNSDIVLYSKIELSRNYEDIPFVCRMNNEQRKLVSKRIFATVKNSQFAANFEMINPNINFVSGLSEDSRCPYLLSDKEDVVIKICEYDHILISAFAAGQDLDTAYAKADSIDELICEKYKIAFLNEFGFLTSNPANLGTAMHASYVLNLGGLKHSGSITEIKNLVSKLGIALSEYNNDYDSAIYILSNNVTLGISEKVAIGNICEICNQIVKKERLAREGLKNDIDFDDTITAEKIREILE